MIAAILAFLNVIPGLGKVAQGITGYIYDAKVKITTARVGGDVSVAQEIVRGAATNQASFYAAVAQSKLLAAIVAGFAIPLIIWFNKVIVWDIVLGWGSTEPIRGQAAEWGNIIIISIFGSGTTLALGNMWFNRKDKA